MSSESPRSAVVRIPVKDFWTLLAQSGLLAAERIEKVRAAYEKVPREGGVEDARPLAKWLIAQGIITRYHGKALLAGQSGPFRFASYTILEPIESGPFQGLFRGRSATNETVLLRFLTGQSLKRPETIARLAAELARWQAVASPGLVVGKDFVDQGSFKFFVVEEIDGETLAERLRVLKVLPVDRACQFIAQVATALTPLHAAGIAHGEILLNRIWIANDGSARLLGYPLVKDPLAAIAEDSPSTPASDVAALGAALYQLVTGLKATTESRPPADHVNPAVPRELAALLERSQSSNLLERPANGAELARLLMPWTGEAPTMELPVPTALPVPAITTGIRIETPTSSSTPYRRPAKKSGYAAPVVIGLTFGAIAVACLAAWQFGWFNSAPTNTAISPRTGPVTETIVAPAPNVESEPIDHAQGYGEPLWQRPFVGKPWSLEFVPSGAQMIVHLRPAALLATVDGEQLSTLPGPGGDWLREALPKVTILPLADLDELTLAFLDEQSDKLPVVAIARTAKPLSTEDFERLPGTTAGFAPAGFRARVAGDRVLLRADGAGPSTTLVSIPASQESLVKELAEARGHAPTLRRELEQLLPFTAEDADFGVLAAPSFLLETLPQFSPEGSAPLWRNLENWLDRGSRAALLSAKLSGDPFLELRTLGDPLRKPRDLAESWETRLQAVPGDVRNFVAARRLIPYDAEVLGQFQQMVLVWSSYTRLGEEDGQFVARSVLPAGALHNLYLAGYLALRTPGAGSTAVAVNPTAQGPKSLAEKLEQPVTLAFPNNSLETSLQLLGEEAGFSVVIEGNDLKIEGITKNQAIRDLDEKDRPAGEILRNILKKADPVGRLVYLVRRTAGTEEEVLVVTTRAAAAQRGDTLPPEMEQP